MSVCNLPPISQSMTPAAPLTLDTLRALKASHLQLLAHLTGTATSGPKLLLATRLHGALHNAHVPLAKTAGGPRPHILSLDMGVRNLAYCTLDLPTSSKAQARSSSRAAPETPDSLPTVRTWRRLALPSATAAPSAIAASRTSKPTFSLPNMALDTAALLRALAFDASQPAAILIERQRWRSGGGAVVQEWTLRVNTLEALLWGGLAVARQEGLWRGACPSDDVGKTDRGVWAVDPGRVARWWLKDVTAGTSEAAKGKKASTGSRWASAATKTNVKRQKLAVVGDWLESGTQVRFVGDAAETRAAFLDRWRSKGRRRTGADVDADHLQAGGAETKLDDLADCLLQAVAWLRWEEHRKMIQERGVDAVHEMV